MIDPSNVGCDNIIELLDDYRRGKLEPHLRVLVSEHLQQCDACAAELRLRDSIASHLVSALPDATATTALPPSVSHAINQMSAGVTTRKSPQLLPLMLGIAVIITIGVAMVQLRSAEPVHTVAAAKPLAAERAALKDSSSEAEEASSNAKAAPAQAFSAPALSKATASRELSAPDGKTLQKAARTDARSSDTAALASPTTPAAAAHTSDTISLQQNTSAPLPASSQ